MRLVLICFAFGCTLLQAQALLPAWTLLVAATCGALILTWAGATLASGGAPAIALTGSVTQGSAVQTHGVMASQSQPLPLRTTAWLAAAAFLLGFAWAGATAHWRLHDALPTEWEGRDIDVIGVIASLPQPFERGVRFEFEVETRLSPGAVVPRHLLLAWYGGYGGDEINSVAPVHAGERWRLTVRLRKPHGNANPHGFDYEAWLLERGVRATGYVRPAARTGARAALPSDARAGGDAGTAGGTQASASNTRLEPFVWSIGTAVDRTRELIRARLLNALDDAPYAGVIVALAVGDQRAIDSADWELFARTGVSHLMSISGLHVTMIASLGAWLVFTLWRRSERLTLWLPAPKAAAAAGALTALLYCLLAGWGVPAQRTLYMLLVAAWALWRGWFGSGSRVLAIALGVVCVLDPWAPLSAGFWLSFGAVALLLLAGNTRNFSGAGSSLRIASAGGASGQRGHWLAIAIRAQLAITLGLTPLTLALFGQVSLAGPLANALAIPLVSFVVTPLALAAAVVPFDTVATLGHWVTEWLMAYLEWLNGFEWAVWQRAEPPWWAVLLALLGASWCLIPWPLAWRLQGVVWMMPLVLLPAPKPAAGDLWLTVLDVGQGLAMVARTREHTLLYDTGPRYSPDADSGNRVVVPFLRGEGVNRLDGMVVTHDDIDHSGGARSVLRAVPTTWISSPLRATHPLLQSGVEHRACTAGQKWEWDGVVFEMLHPRAIDHLVDDTPATATPAPPASTARAKRDNMMSCVLRISAQGRTALLTADIEADVEGLLVASGTPLHSDVMIAPHHGSKTSSTAAFLAAVNPQTIVIPVGYRNRFRHPAPEVLERYRTTGAHLLRTDADGAVTLHFTAAGVAAEAWRQRRARYWHAR